MMGPRQRRAAKLFYTDVDLEERVPADHPLRRVAAAVDFAWVREAVRPLYGRRGHPSVDPVVLLKLMFVLFFENVSSERALMKALPLRLDWLWFCGYDLDDVVPDHSVISKARRRWGPDVFKVFFERVLDQCVAAGLVDGERVHVDSTLVSASADRRALVPAWVLAARGLYERLEAAAQAPGGVENVGPEAAATDAAPAEEAPVAEGAAEPAAPPQGSAQVLVSTTDPDARLTRKYNQPVLGYKDHRAVDDRCGIITATVTTSAAVADEAMLEEVLDGHEAGVGQAVEMVVADSRYGTGATYHALRGRGVQPCIPPMRRARSGRFGPERFTYEVTTDTYMCPAGHRLKRSDRRAQKDAMRYYAPRGACPACPLKGQCTRGPRRQIARHAYQEDIDWAAACVGPGARRYWLRRRSVRAEGSFADASQRHGSKRARWRRLWRVTIQNQLIAAVQNVRKWLRHARRRKEAGQKRASSSAHVRSLLWAVAVGLRHALGRARALFWASCAPPSAFRSTRAAFARPAAN